MNKQNTKSDSMIFGRINYQLLIGGLILIIIGFVLMSGGGSDDPNSFDYSTFSVTKIRIAPAIIILGLIMEIIAILYKPKKD